MDDKYYLYKSSDKKKKFEVRFKNPETKRYKGVKFGAYGMSDYTKHKDDERKERYISRHKNEDWDDLTKAGTWSRFLLWNKKTLDESIKDMEKRFNIDIIY